MLRISGFISQNKSLNTKQECLSDLLAELVQGHIEGNGKSLQLKGKKLREVDKESFIYDNMSWNENVISIMKYLQNPNADKSESQLLNGRLNNVGLATHQTI